MEAFEPRVMLSVAAGELFELPKTFDVGGRPVALLVADMNGDGFDDLVTGVNDTSSISVAINDQAGGFNLPVSFEVGDNVNPTRLVIEDFDQDGDMDVLSFGASNQFALMVNNGAGLLAKQVIPITHSAQTQDFYVGDVNGDGESDLIFSGQEVHVHLGQGDGTFANDEIFSPVLANLRHAVLGDFNGDGQLDIADVGTAGFAVLRVYAGNGAGGFDEDPSQTLDLPISLTQNHVITIAAGDVVGDAHHDVVIYLRENSTDEPLLAIYANEGDAGLQEPIIVEGFTLDFPKTTTTAYRHLLDIVDVNGDQLNDIIVADESDAVVYLNTGNTLAFSAEFAGPFFTRSVAAADFDQDGHVDLAVAGAAFSGVGVVSVLPGRVGSFAAPNFGGRIPDGRLNPRFVDDSATGGFAIGDVNNDGHDDLAVLNIAYDGLTVWLNDGLGQFVTPTSMETGDDPIWIDFGDLNNDGLLDLVVAARSDDQINVFLGNGDGTFMPRFDFDIGNTPVTVFLVDINGDEHLDVVSNSDDQAVNILLGAGNGAFTGRDDFDLGFTPHLMRVGDADDDGDIDLFFIGGVASSVTFYDNDGAGGLSVRHAEVFNLGVPGDMALADLDDNGFLDVVISSHSRRDIVTILFGDDAGYTRRDDLSFAGTPFGPTSLAAGDINGDGWLDLIGIVDDSSARVYLNSGNGVFAADATVIEPSGQYRKAGLHDINHDGNADLLFYRSEFDVVIFESIADQVTAPAAELTTLVASQPVSAIAFNQFNAQDVSTVTLTLRNDGDGDLFIFGTAIQHADPAAAVFSSSPTNIVGNDNSDVLLAHGETADMTVTFTRAFQAGGATGVLQLFTNDPAGPVIELPLNMASPQPETPTITVVATDPAPAEAGTATGTFMFTRTGDTDDDLTVAYAVTGSATAGADYASLTGFVTIPAGSASAIVVITPIDDDIDELDETVVVTLIDDTEDYDLGTPFTAAITIADNDDAPDPVTTTDLTASIAKLAIGKKNQTTFLPGDNVKVTAAIASTNDSEQINAGLSLQLVAEDVDTGAVFVIGQADVKGKLKPGKSKKVTIKSELPDTLDLPPADYRFVVIADPDDAIEESDESNNEAADAGVYMVEQPTIAFEPTAGKTKLKLGKKGVTTAGNKGKLTAKVLNSGNSSSDGLLGATLVARPAVGDDILLAAAPPAKKFKVSAGKSKAFKLNFTLPDDITTGAYSLILTFDFDAAAGTTMAINAGQEFDAGAIDVSAST